MDEIRFAWCLLFHRRYHRRTGKRHMGKVSITYDLFCIKCCLDVPSEVVWLLK